MCYTEYNILIDPPAPMNVKLTDVSPNYLTFSWTHVQSSCQVLSYKSIIIAL